MHFFSLGHQHFKTSVQRIRVDSLIDPFLDAILPHFVHDASHTTRNNSISQSSIALLPENNYGVVEDSITPDDSNSFPLVHEEVHNHEFAPEEIQNYGAEDNGSDHANVSNEVSNGIVVPIAISISSSTRLASSST
ncbi:hypothetical protein V6N11_020627 [Hibiscus sabdariffa]|uniref:Uncharacterized protein n=1 Tax=Hibiscus sabdariffa TaxID=183260 RepID=A0ABR2Q9E1_9ROSI